jgi:hypothetical protein
MEDLQLQLFTLLAAIFLIILGYLLQQWHLQPDLPGFQQQEKDRTVTLPPFWTRRPAAWFAFAEIKFREKSVDKQARNFDLLLAALPKKVQDQMMDVIDNVLADVPYDTSKARFLERRPTRCRTRRKWMSCSRWNR